ncbi:hypothetical protein C4552_02715 [Candidatus Parcubacteria bacterium]|nr:MAG: hypothetical protein C4552_02715 [Candidatus Parcubacteria bacterium]
MALPNLEQFFFTPRSSDLATIWREFLGYFVKQFWPGVNTQIDKLPLTRLDFPLLTLPFFLIAFLALLAFWERPRPRNAIFAGVAGGLLGYVYFHTWIYWMAVLGMTAVAAAFSYIREGDRARLRGAAIMLGSAAVTLAPYAMNFVRFTRAEGQEDFLLRLSLAEGREFFWVGLGFDYLAYIVLGAFAWLIYGKRDRMRAIFLIILIAAMPVIWNVQLVTGFVPAPDHWPKATSVTIFIIVSLMVFELARRISERSRRAAILITALIALGSLAVVAKKAVNVAMLAREPQQWIINKHFFPKDIAASWEWINEHIPGEPRIISSSFLTSQYLAVYTSARPYLPQSIISPLPQDELEARYLTASKLFAVAPETLAAQLASEPPAIACVGPLCYYRDENFRKLTDDLYACYFSRGAVNEYFRQGCGRVPDDRREELIRRYETLQVQWSDVAAEYVYYGPWELQFGNPDFDRDPALRRVYENPIVKIYQIVAPAPRERAASLP